MSTDNNTQAQEDTKEVQTVEVKAEETKPEEREESLGDVLETKVEVVKPKAEKPKTVPIELFLELKKELKEAKSEKGSSFSGDSSIEDIAKEYDVDVAFVGKLAKAIETNTAKQFEEKFSGKFQEIENKTKRETVDKKFNDLFEKTIGSFPELEGVVNKDVIKQLALNPANSKKTMTQIIEEVYGHTAQGKKTIETATANAGDKTETVDFSKAGDPAVYARIKADPKLKEEYNQYVIKHLN